MGKCEILEKDNNVTSLHSSINKPLPLTKVAIDPFDQFSEWYEEAQKAMPNQLVNAMTLSTVGPDNRPSSRMVLLKQFDHNGFIFFSNYNSRKGQHINANHFVALLFWWEKIGRQVRIEGRVERINSKLSDEYFQSRSKESQISALVSAQSSVVDTKQLQVEYEKMFEQYSDNKTPIPRPPHWGGYIVKPDLIEFWQEGVHRMHSRFEYRILSNRWQTDHNVHWQIERLAP